MKKVLILACLMAGMLCACSSDDDSLDVPEKGNFVPNVSDKTGTVWYDSIDESWYINMDLPPLPEGNYYIDSAILYYTYNLPQQYQQEGLRVKVSGDIYDYHFRNENHVVLGGHEYYYIALKKIEQHEDLFCGYKETGSL